MCIGSEFALVGLDMIPDAAQRETVRRRLEASGKKVIELTSRSNREFRRQRPRTTERFREAAGPVEPCRRGADHGQRNEIERHARLLPLALPTIELAGGSARCMLAAIHLPPL